MPLPLPLQANATAAQIANFETALRQFVEQCYPNDQGKAAIAWEIIQKKKLLGPAERATLSTSGLISRLGAIHVLLDDVKVPTAAALERECNFKF